MNVLDAIGNTSMVRLRRIVPASGARILVKLEAENPTGSMKDRMALGVIEARRGERPPGKGGTVVEYTGGSTGASLALVCGARGYRLGSSPATRSAGRSSTRWPRSAPSSRSCRARAG
jgi:cysteine synthase A